MTKQFYKRPTVAEFIAERIFASDMTQREISEQCGFEQGAEGVSGRTIIFGP